ncbi:hypothetical protein FisN_14Lh377 [Fistulifera solaris]|uniref:3',5'-cyclic-nucleotide phosphodiesterase n=1 Tax=Fistulifera solaris TaxID=1519565 RepID=A0A1Z5JHX8_FISSO|nr:hypothetical protein FisN_14Lh377 [Fistulifera solaris]|eukprot:GAX13615.1 hypothetical protein FisN_14Lh377 [Fistulifera solaris]
MKSPDSELIVSEFERENMLEKSSTHGSDASLAEGIGRYEGRLVNRSKVILYVTLCLAGVCISLATFFFIKNQEEATFESEFRNLANEIIDVATSNTENTIGQIRSISTAYASYAGDSPSRSWPNITLPHFKHQVFESIRLTGAEWIAFLPRISREQQAGFEAFAQEEYIRLGMANTSTSLPQEIRSTNGNSLEKDYFAPIWQIAPLSASADVLLIDMDSFPWFKEVKADVLRTNHAIMSRVVDIDPTVAAEDDHDGDYHPHTVILNGIPRFDGDVLVDDFENDRFGFIMAVLPWEVYFTEVIPSDTFGFLVEVDDHCGSVFTYVINGHHAQVLGEGKLHNSKYDYLHEFADWSMLASEGNLIEGIDNPEQLTCYYTIDVYPTDELKAVYTSGDQVVFAVAILAVFVFIVGIFFVYDVAVQRRQDRVTRVARQTAKIVNSLFPKNVQRRIMEEAQQAAEADEEKQHGFRFSAKDRLKKALLSNGTDDDQDRLKNAPPIADLFPSTTIMFGDLVGFTAWSSMREPAQVFQLLETIYSEFDEIAKKRRIFKVETVGDCYVAACGIPDPRRDHVVAMARFARDCRNRMMALMTDLETKLGPDTGELGLRIGLHSGPVTGGVLRGEKARFQLFGDTMNTTARIETTGKKNMIHLSEETAILLQAFGKGHWVKLREDKVQAKGKGELTTYWLVKDDGPHSTTSSGNSPSDGDDDAAASDEENDGGTAICIESTFAETSALTEKVQRLVKWNAEVLGKILKEVIQRRKARKNPPDFIAVRRLEEETKLGRVLEEATDILALPTFDAEAAARQEALPPVILDEKVTQQLEAFIHAIAMMYHDNAFHNFEHASHVTMSVTKLFSRIVVPEVSGDERTLHDHTYGITSDPLTQFAAAFAALIHDVDHQGVTNATLIEENSPIAAVYKNKSVAEQNSVDIAWSLLMDESFIDLRNCIYTTPAGYQRFRQLVVNSVMATDIMDRTLSQARKDRWAKAFAESEGDDNNPMEDYQKQINRKATIVLEHVIQASDVSHTMQHWHIYRKWNARLFEEMNAAYRQGRTQKNPADTWYEGEIGFFDFYIIPLAKKLKECGVFGVSSDEYLNYAEKNRKEWEAKGREVVAEMVAKLQSAPPSVEYQLSM